MSSLLSVPSALVLAATAWCALPSVDSRVVSSEAPIEASTSPYHSALRKLQQELESARGIAGDSDELLRLQSELSELTRAAEAAITQGS